MRKVLLYASCLFLAVFGLYQINRTVFAEQSGSSPESGTDSRIKIAYDWLVAKGANYGSTDAADWTNDWSTWWNRIMESAAWEPDGTATDGEIPSGLTFYADNGDRTQKTGTLYVNQANMAYDDYNCAANNQEATGTCAGGDSEYTGEEGSEYAGAAGTKWQKTSEGGTARSVTDNAITVTLVSNTVYQDNRTELYWSNRSSTTVDNEFAYVDGDDRSNPAGNSCNFNSTGTANDYCDFQDPLGAYVEDDDVSAAEFCLNLELDADGDGDNDLETNLESDWRLPTQKELMQAYINGAANNLPSVAANHWSSTEDYNTQSNAWRVYLYSGYTRASTKVTGYTVRCVRREQTLRLRLY